MQFDPLQTYVEQNELKLHLVMEYGSQVFNLDTPESDTDYLAVVSQDSDKYLGLIEPNQTWATLSSIDVSYQFMDLKRFFQLSQSSNFTLYVGLQNVVWNSYVLPHLPNPFKFSMNRLAHHCLGLIDNKSQRQYMKAYSSLFVMFLMQNGHLPSTLDYKFLLDSVKDVPMNVKRLLELKKENVKLTEVNVNKPYTHDDVNFLPDVKLDFNDYWLAYLKESYA